ncbi:heparan-alpha-glucosaminide N-acetyltransferase domain-containing protein [Streptomyces phaeochromogenes]|uniref:heparan-alpha-glucosaminide N-acetyltransferase domain-containing protein n=1 Tax=Streptomyces phaeochromogenes TaxID=1923 RepID=UPI002255F3AF|nr:heparan-alpha-glucosaminide N-acetyltransferase domain-containing protein [Streptomyces phaeochromogenes]MCX5601202.1 heparan-alpha-glucosaminide N-acetyltransferase domain-containing protein [Streptomyces phaeochromogenes]
MTSTDTPTGTDSTSARIPGIDLARGFAILGMFGAHTLVTRPLEWDPSSWPDLVHGRSSILFATLAGVSVALMTGGARPYDGVALRDARTRVIVRAILLLALGSLLTLLDSIAVILEVYAVLLVVSVLFLRWSSRRLFVAAALVAATGKAGTFLLSGMLPDPSEDGAGFIVDLTLQGTYPAFIWAAFILLGLGVGRLDLGSRRVRLRLIAAGALMAAIGYGGAWASSQLHSVATSQEDVYASIEPVWGEDIDITGLSCQEYEEGAVYCSSPGAVEGNSSSTGFSELVSQLTDQLVGADPHSGTPFEALGSSGVALLILALCLLMPRTLRRPLYPVAAAGTMALTLYTAHAVALAFTQNYLYEQPTRLYGVLVGGALVFAIAWRRWLGQGPLERLLSGVSKRANTASANQTPVLAPHEARSPV